MKRICLALLVAWLWPFASLAHEVRPAFLEIKASGGDVYAVLWKTPMRGDARLALRPVFAGDSAMITPVLTRTPGDAAIQTWTMRAPSLRGQELRIDGLEGTMTDALVHIEFADGTSWTQRLTPQRPAATIPVRDPLLAVAGTYLMLGVEHILGGIDHLLFVLALMLVARGRVQLLLTVTAFTLAHSVTLALATLGIVNFAQAPVEALIALSIAFVAVEIVRVRQGRPSIAARAPWTVAFAFGLLHGLGFAGALSEIGLPEGRIPLALLFFNLGVELGQLIFVAGVLGSVRALRSAAAMLPRWTALVTPYAVGIIAMFWFFQRLATF
jgi:HupE / UreJ protein